MLLAFFPIYANKFQPASGSIKRNSLNPRARAVLGLRLGQLRDTARRWAELRWTRPSGLRRARSACRAGVWRQAGDCAAPGRSCFCPQVSLVSTGASEQVNPVDSTFRVRRGSRSILAYIRRASALPPPLPPARSGAAPSTPPLRAPPRTPARPTPGGDSRWTVGGRAAAGEPRPYRSARIRAGSASQARHSSRSCHLPIPGAWAILAGAGTREQRPLVWRRSCGSCRGGHAAPPSTSRVGAEH